MKNLTQELIREYLRGILLGKGYFHSLTDKIGCKKLILQLHLLILKSSALVVSFPLFDVLLEGPILPTQFTCLKRMFALASFCPIGRNYISL